MMDTSTIVIVVLVSRVYAYVKMYHIVQFRYVKFIVCQWHLNKTLKKKFLAATLFPKEITEWR